MTSSLPSFFHLFLLVCSSSFIHFTFVHANDDDMVYPAFTEDGCLKLPKLICTLSATEGNNVNGTVYFHPVWEKRDETSSEMTCYTRIEAQVYNLNSAINHGFHIHTYGDLSQSNGKSTGGHFTNPANDDIPHGWPTDNPRHWGDLGNLTADSTGFANYSVIDNVIRLGGILGRGITIHAEGDKGPSEQPSGDAGSRIAYGVIGYANPELIV